VSGGSIINRAQRLRRRGAIAAIAALLSGFSTGCTAPSQTAVDKIRAIAEQKCHEGNQPACDTIVQPLTDTKVAIESTGVLPTLTPACNAGKHDACQQLAVLRAELSSWCAANNARACAAVNVGPWPQNSDVPALVDSAKLACLSGQLKADSATCHSLENF